MNAAAGGVIDYSKVIKIEELDAKERVRSIVLYGATEAFRKVNIKPETEGRLVAIEAEEGTVVKQGQVILRLDLRDREARVSQTKALVAQRELEFQAAKELNKKGFRTEVGLAEARTNLENAKTDLLRAELDLRHTAIRAPFDGILEKVNADLGDFVAVGFFGGEAALATMVDYDPMLVVGQVAEGDRSFLKIGETATLKLATGLQVEGRVRYIGSVADTASRTFRVEVEVANPDRAIPTGITAQMQLPADRVRAYLISPASLSLDDKGVVGVKTLSDNRVVEFHPVKLVEDSKEGIWVSGLPEKIRLISTGQAFVSAGQVIPDTAAPPAQPEAAKD